jgi:hypothetical protein
MYQGRPMTEGVSRHRCALASLFVRLARTSLLYKPQHDMVHTQRALIKSVCQRKEGSKDLRNSHLFLCLISHLHARISEPAHVRSNFQVTHLFSHRGGRLAHHPSPCRLGYQHALLRRRCESPRAGRKTPGRSSAWLSQEFASRTSSRCTFCYGHPVCGASA